MNLSKINSEILNIQNSILMYENITKKIENKIKENYKLINKLDNNFKNTNEQIFKIFIGILEHETEFLKKLMEDDINGKENN